MNFELRLKPRRCNSFRKDVFDVLGLFLFEILIIAHVSNHRRAYQYVIILSQTN